MGMEDEALRRHDFSIKGSELLRDPFLQASLLDNSMRFLRRREDVIAALKTAEQLHNVVADLELPVYMFSINYTKDWALTKTGRAVEAAKNVESSLEVFDKFFSDHTRFGNYSAFALFYIKAGQLEEAEQLLERGLSAMTEGGVLHEAEFYCIRGELYLAKATHLLSAINLELAERSLRKAFTLARERNQVLMAQQAANLLSSVLRFQERHPEIGEVEIEMQRLREDAAGRAEKILAATGVLLPSEPEELTR
jgi:tetratricopeptide (TPR) repeat protein